jgi:hypothetical protein
MTDWLVGLEPLQLHCLFITTCQTKLQIWNEWSPSQSGYSNPGERSCGTHWIGGWLDPKSSVDIMAEEELIFLPLPRIEPQSSSP